MSGHDERATLRDELLQPFGQFIIHQCHLGRENNPVTAQVGGRAHEINVVPLLRGGLKKRVLNRADIYLFRQILVIEDPLVFEVLDYGDLRNDF